MKNISDIILNPILSEKSNMLMSQNKYVFRVSLNSNKLQIKKAIEERFEVAIDKVSTMNFKGKKKNSTIRSGGNVIRTSWNRRNWKKAIVTLSKGHKIDFVEGDF